MNLEPEIYYLLISFCVILTLPLICLICIWFSCKLVKTLKSL